MSAIDLVKRSYDAFERGDLDGVLGDMDPDIEWHQAQGRDKAIRFRQFLDTAGWVAPLRI